MAGPRLVTAAVLLLLCWGTHQTDAQVLTVSITVSGTPPPGFTPCPNEYRAASGPYTFTCTATGGPGSGDYDFVWTSTCSSCLFQTSFIGETSVITRQAFHSGDSGTHTCTATRGGQSGSDSIEVSIVGAGIFVFTGAGETGAQPNNGLVISIVSGQRFRFVCRSNSLTFGVGELIGLDGNPVINSGFFEFRTPLRGGELRIFSTVGSEDPLTASEQGVYTCRMPLEGGGEREINIGIYPNGFSTSPSIANPLVFTLGSSSSSLTCISTGSVATTVTFMRNGTTVGPLRDGESMEFSGVTYQLVQTVTSRAQSTYQNVLTISQPLADIVGSTFTFRVENTIGPSPDSQPLTIMAIEITISPPIPTVGETATFTCTSLLGQADMIEWLGVDGESEQPVVTSNDQATLDLVFNPVREGLDGGTFRCRVTIGGATVDQDVTVTVQVPRVTALITPSGFAVVGMSYTLTCTVSGADNLEATISLEFTGPNSVSGTGTSLQLPLTLDLTDAGRYTCTAIVTSRLLPVSGFLISTDREDISLQIPSSAVDVVHDGGIIIYAGSVLTLTCEISLVDSVPPNLRSDVTVMTTWLGTSGNPLSTGGVITVNPAMGSGAAYTSTVVFNTVRTFFAGTYTCQATVTHSSQFITDVTTSGVVMISVQEPTLTLAVLSSTTRLPNMSPHNTFTLTCTATAPMGVIESKTFTWRRRSGSGGSCGSFSEVIDGGALQITNSNVDQPVSTSVLAVTETTAAVWRYCCQASLLGVTGTSDEVAVTVTGPAPPQQPTNLMNVDTSLISAMIQWTVPIIAYTPETYVVNYGTSMSLLNVMSNPVQSGSDFEAVNQVFSVELTGLVDTTTYFYQVVAANGQGSTSSDRERFNTSILRPGPPQNFMLIVSTTASLTFSWNLPIPIAGVNLPTRYIVRCEPQLVGIDTPAPVNLSISQETAIVINLFPGVTYRCSVTAMNDRGEGDSAELSVMTLETVPAVSITVSGTPPPGFTPGPNEYRAASGPYTFTCTATGFAGSGDFQYVWTSTCSSCAFQTSFNGTTSVIIRGALNSGDGGTHTCTATRGGQSGSDSIIVTIVGIGIFVSSGSGEIGAQPNNGLVISTDPSTGRRFRFFCRSNSLTIGVGELIGLDDGPVVANNFLEFPTPLVGGGLIVENTVGSADPLPASEQGVYTCHMPLDGGGQGEVNIGIYRIGFNTIPSIINPLVFTPGSSSSTLTCTSTGSVATTVTFMTDSTTVGPLRDGESMEFGGVTYQLAQTATNRAQSTYQNVLTINQPLADIVGSTFTCRVENTIGPSIPDSQPLTIMGLGPPRNFILTMSTNTSLSFSWNSPAPIAGINPPTRYIVRCEPQLEGIGTPAVVNQSALQETATIIGLATGVTYSCSVAAMNDLGEGTPAEVSAVAQEIEEPIMIGFNQAQYRESEGAGAVPVTVQLLAGRLERMITVRMYTMDGEAIAPADYRAVDMTMTFGPLMTSYTTQIEIVEDNFLETNEHFFVRLEIVSSGVLLSLSRNQARVIIESNDACPRAGVRVSENPLVSTDPLAIYCVDVCYRRFRRGRICHG